MISNLPLPKTWVLLIMSLLGAALVPVYGTGETPVTPETPSQEVKIEKSDSSTSKPAPVTHESASEEETLIQQLRDRVKELDAREEQLRVEAQRVEALRRDFEDLAAQQSKLAAAVAEEAQQKKEQSQEDPTQESLKKLVKVYEEMDPEEAALRIEKMKEPLALDILAGIKERKTARILAGVTPNKAASLSQGLRYYVKNQNQRSGKP